MPLYETFTLGTSANLITFNDDSSAPYYRATRKNFTRKQLEEYDIKLPEGPGIADYQSYQGKQYVVIEGTMYPDDEADYDNGRKALRKVASLDIQQADANSDQGYVPLKWTEYDGHNKQLHVKIIQADLPETTRNGLKQPFRLLGKIKYPVIFAQTATTVTVGDSAATVSGSSGLPWLLPKAVGKTTYSSNGTITNAGDLSTYPSITIVGPISRPRLTNSTSSEYLEVDVNLVTSSDSLIVTYDQDTVSITQAGVSKYGNLTSGSKLFKIKPGTNTLTLTGSTVGSGAYASVSINSAWPLS